MVQNPLYHRLINKMGGPSTRRIVLVVGGIFAASVLTVILLRLYYIDNAPNVPTFQRGIILLDVLVQFYQFVVILVIAASSVVLTLSLTDANSYDILRMTSLAPEQTVPAYVGALLYRFRFIGLIALAVIPLVYIADWRLAAPQNFPQPYARLLLVEMFLYALSLSGRMILAVTSGVWLALLMKRKYAAAVYNVGILFVFGLLALAVNNLNGPLHLGYFPVRLPNLPDLRMIEIGLTMLQVAGYAILSYESMYLSRQVI